MSIPTYSLYQTAFFLIKMSVFLAFLGPFGSSKGYLKCAGQSENKTGPSVEFQIIISAKKFLNIDDT